MPEKNRDLIKMSVSVKQSGDIDWNLHIPTPIQPSTSHAPNDHFCYFGSEQNEQGKYELRLVECIGGSLDGFEPTAENLIRVLARQLGYKLVPDPVSRGEYSKVRAATVAALIFSRNKKHRIGGSDNRAIATSTERRDL